MGYAYPIDSKVITNPNGTIDYDRAYSSANIRGIIKAMITNGINLIESTNLQVFADEETMKLIVNPGYVIIEGALKHFEDDVKITIPTSDTSKPRIDTIVARLNLNEDVRDIVIDVLQGTPASNPVAPELTRTTSYYELGLADIYVDVGVIQISQANVTDTRLLNSRCGLATSISEVDTETLFTQLTTDFGNWFNGIKNEFESWFNTEEDEYTQWVNNKQQEYDNWTENKQQEYDTWTENKQQGYDSWTENKQQEYDTWTDNKQQEYESWTDEEKRKYTDWINSIETDLGDDVALSMKLQIDEMVTDIKELELRLNEAVCKQTVFNEDGSITEFIEDEKRNTIFNEDGTITVQYYVSDELLGTKTISFDENTITEVFE